VIVVSSSQPWPERFREAHPGDHPYRFLIHDRDSIFSKQVRLDKGVTDLQ